MRKTIRSLLYLLAIAAAAAPAAVAQDFASDTDFRGVSAVRVTLSPMSVESIDCNIEGNTLIRELQRQFEGEGLASSPALDTLAVITVLSSRDGQGACNSAVMLGAYKKASFFDDEAQWLRTGYVVVWQSALLVASPVGTHPAVARDALARLAEAMLTAWRSANSTPSAVH